MNTDVKCSIIEASSNELLYQIEVHNGLIPAYIMKKHDGPIPYIHTPFRNNTKPKPRIQTDLHSSYQSKVSETQERTRPAYLAPTQTFKARPHTRYTPLKLYMFQSKILDLSNCNACQVQSVSDKFKTVCIKSKTCPMLRIEISFKVLVHDRFRSNFISSAQVRTPKSNQETCHPQFTTATTKLSIISQCVQSTTNNRNS